MTYRDRSDTAHALSTLRAALAFFTLLLSAIAPARVKDERTRDHHVQAAAASPNSFSTMTQSRHSPSSLPWRR
jgi:hypothetical protein